MTKTLKELFKRATRWPQEVQDEAFETLRSIEKGHSGGYRLTAEDKEALRRSAEDVRRGRFASHKKVAAFFKRTRA